MSLWEFRLQRDDEIVVEQTIVAEGGSEAEAAAAATEIVNHPGVTLTRPGVASAPEVEARWRELLDGSRPGAFSDMGRLARYARGLPLTTILFAIASALG